MKDRTRSEARAVSGAAAAVSAAALACGAGCVLPFALPASMLAGLGGTLAWLALAYSWLAPIALVSVVAAWAWIIFNAQKTNRRPARSTIAWLVFATAAMALAWFWPEFEPRVIAAIGRPL